MNKLDFIEPPYHVSFEVPPNEFWIIGNAGKILKFSTVNGEIIDTGYFVVKDDEKFWVSTLSSPTTGL